MDFKDVVNTRRSVRNFSEEELEKDTVDRVLACASSAPSANNSQPWRFIAVKGTGSKRRIAQACYGQNFIADAPVIIVCCSVPQENEYEPWRGASHRFDTVIAATHLVLAAREEGLGTCWIGSFEQDKIKTIIAAPEELEVIAVIPMGHPISESSFREPYGRLKLDDIRFFEQYGENDY